MKNLEQRIEENYGTMTPIDDPMFSRVEMLQQMLENLKNQTEFVHEMEKYDLIEFFEYTHHANLLIEVLDLTPFITEIDPYNKKITFYLKKPNIKPLFKALKKALLNELKREQQNLTPNNVIPFRRKDER